MHLNKMVKQDGGNMSRQLKRKYRKVRQQFKRELKIKCEHNRALAMLIYETYRAQHHYRHITQIWSMFRNPEFHNFRQAYTKELFGKVLSGSDDIWYSLYFAERELYDKFNGLIPQSFAMGDAFGIALKVLRNYSTKPYRNYYHCHSVDEDWEDMVAKGYAEKQIYEDGIYCDKISIRIIL